MISSPRLRRLAALPLSFYRRPAETVARDLLGRWLVHRLDGARMVVRLVETEAYLGAPDRASHAWGGRRTARNESLYLPGGHAYVYFIYGMHFCLNAVTGEPGVGSVTGHPGTRTLSGERGSSGMGSAVLLRAGEPLEGEGRMRELRGLRGEPRPGDLAGGPGKLCQALAIGRRLDGVRLDRGPLTICEGDPVEPAAIASGPRIGVAYAGEAATWPLRFAIRGNPHVSRPRPI